jgi:hypothetical protein
MVSTDLILPNLADRWARGGRVESWPCHPSERPEFAAALSEDRNTNFLTSLMADGLQCTDDLIIESRCLRGIGNIHETSLTQDLYGTHGGGGEKPVQAIVSHPSIDIDPDEGRHECQDEDG